MCVYVDRIANHGGSATFKWKRSCHMFADDIDELHRFALSIGMKREWFQDDARLPHYDLNERRRAVAVRKGAIEVGWREVWERMKGNGQKTLNTR